jgi:hypothetical protein
MNGKDTGEDYITINKGRQSRQTIAAVQSGAT